ncbi:MAG: AAA family ATPase [Chloroflexaceae bacterium]|nr:AAA family ATPase [Chloroflexaceae bacterium]
MEEGFRFIHSLHLKNFLSYGSEGERIELGPLNVLIGSNASGKSNLIEAVSLLQALPSNLVEPIRDGGGVSEWLWKGSRETPVAELEAVVDYPPGGGIPLRYKLQFTMTGQRLELLDEAVENARKLKSQHSDVYFFYRYQQGQPVLNVRNSPEAEPGTDKERQPRYLRREDLKPDQSVLSQRKDPDQYPELTYLGNQFSEIKLYREWNLGRYTDPRKPQKTDLPEDFLEENASNLGLVINNLQNSEGSRALVEQMQLFYEDVEEISTKIQGGTVQLFLRERGLEQPIPATRLSDGTLRYLCLLTILCHPQPPSLVCIEEPELGLHPDIIRTLAKLLIDASQRSQLIVTTHSDILVSALTEQPESVIVCERDIAGSHLRRLGAGAVEELARTLFSG